MSATTERPIDQWFAHYSGDHQNAMNQRIHVIAVPLILWSVIGLLWCIPAPLSGLWAALAMFLAWMFYFHAAPVIGFGMLAIFVAMAWFTRWLHDSYGTSGLLKIALGVFVVAWIAQFIGHSKLFEGKKPSFFTDLKYLLIGPAWVLAKLYRKLGLRW